MSKLLALTLAGLLGVSLAACESVPKVTADDYLVEAQQKNIALIEQLRRDRANPAMTPQSAAKLDALLAESLARSEHIDALRQSRRSEREANQFMDWWTLQQQQQRSFYRQQQWQQQQWWALQQQRNWALQQHRMPIQPAPLYYPPPLWITP